MAFTHIETPLERRLGEALDAATAYFGEPITRTRVMEKTKRMQVVRPRQWCMAYIRWKNPEMSLPRTARMFGMKDHTTVLHAERRAKELFPDAVFCPLPGLLDRENVDAA